MNDSDFKDKEDKLVAPVHEEKKKEKVGCLSYVIAVFSFIPLIGVLFGLIAIIWGIVNRNKRGWQIVVALGSVGIIITIVLYSTLVLPI